MKSTRFTFDEAQFASAVCSLLAASQARGNKLVKCRLTKTRLRISTNWGEAIIPAKSSAVMDFSFKPIGLVKLAAGYRKYEGSKINAPAEVDLLSKYFRTSRATISLL